VASQLRLLSNNVPPASALLAALPFDDGVARVAAPPALRGAPGPGIDLDSLRCFDAVATTLRFRSAAARVHLSPGAFSDRIGRLEEGLGTRILRRTTRKVTLTDAGQRLLPVARRILQLVDRMPGAAAEDPAPLQYALTVGTRYELGLSWLCEILDPLERKQPDRTLHLYNASTADLLAKIERGEIDAAVTSARLNSPRLTYAALHIEAYVLVGAERRLNQRDDASSATLVDTDPDLPLFRYFLDAHPDAEPWPFARVEYMGGIANVRRRLLAGGGRVGVLPTLFVKDDLAKRRLHRLMPRIDLQSDSLRLVWRMDHPRQAELLTLARDLREFPLR
jgi:LysR family glycine cleavage system transcriptional activator